MNEARELRVLELALSHLEIARSHAASDHSDAVVTDAVALRLAAVDALANLSDDTRALATQGQWDLMRGMRNRIVHGYATVSPDVVRATVDREVDPLIRRIRQAIDTLSGAS